MEKTYITITHLDEFYAAERLMPGTVLTLKKEPNSYDDESISVYSSRGSKCGYVGNCCDTVAVGTHSAGYIYRDFERTAECVVRFRQDCTAIAELISQSMKTVGDTDGNIS